MCLLIPAFSVAQKMGDTYIDFSKAAREGDLASIKTASRKDINKRDENGMTPVPWAAAYGKIEALRILIGKGFVFS